MSSYDHNNPKVGDRVFYNGGWTTILEVRQGQYGKQCRLSNGFDNVVPGLDPRFDIAKTSVRDLLEAVVDAVGETFGVDTGNCSLHVYEEAVEAVDKVLEEFAEPPEEPQ